MSDPARLGFSDHFSGVADAYAANRPGYPPALIDVLADASPGPTLAVDVGCGSGQLTGALASQFAQMAACDPAEAQIRRAPRLENTVYAVAAAEALPIADGAADLIAAAQAAHWFDLNQFYAEARRIARPGAAIVLIAYPTAQIEGDAGATFRRYYSKVVGPYWPAERALVEGGYRDLPFPFEPIASPQLIFEADWPLARVAGYAASWSATKRYREATGTDPIPRLETDLREVWGASEGTKRVSWPIAMKLGRIK